VIDGDVKTNGNLVSQVPTGLNFDLVGSGGFPGVPAYGGSSNLNNTLVSVKGWLAGSKYVISNNKVYNYSFFNHWVPADTLIDPVPPGGTVSGSYFKTEGDPSYSYYWFKYDTTVYHLDLHVASPINLGDRKVILFVDSADVYFEGDIKVNDGSGFFLVITKKIFILTLKLRIYRGFL
jgi:hypothetical protein